MNWATILLKPYYYSCCQWYVLQTLVEDVLQEVSIHDTIQSTFKEIRSNHSVSEDATLDIDTPPMMGVHFSQPERTDLRPISDLYTKGCKEFNFLHPEEFYAVSYPAWRRFFDESQGYKVMQALKDSHGAHLWNKLSKNETVRLGSNQAFSIMALRSCPRLFERAEGVRAVKCFRAISTCCVVVLTIYLSNIVFQHKRTIAHERGPAGFKGTPSAYPLVDGDNQTQKGQTVVIKRTERVTFEEQPRPGGKHIIFLETRCLTKQSAPHNHSGLLLHPRQACALESAARMNPDYKVYLLYSCPVIGGLGRSREYVKAVLTYPNVKLWELNVKDLLMKTPLENWDFLAAIRSSRWPVEHAGNVLRLLTLWKYGGTCIDLDVILLKSLADLAPNYFVFQSRNSVANSVMNCAHEGVGHEVATQLLQNLRNNFRPSITFHVARKFCDHCNVSKVSDLSTHTCKGFKFLPVKEFYAMKYYQWRSFSTQSMAKSAMQKIKDSHGVHLWNKLSKQGRIIAGSNPVLSIIAPTSCPRISKSVNGTL
ncbi:lactosylceramide 4-alpha-galactosyltransferase-like [Periplaneta americana]|uniref:lactosylceramide 4-alpha-galactosyltransferase-like n=1 Tax=Periplaneta americana TaxID=6978 RepID=UPI0037E847C0